MQLALILMLVPALAYGEPCETVTYSPISKPSVSKAQRTSAVAIGPKKNVVVRKPRSQVARTRTVTRYDCPPPRNTYPGYPRIVPGVPYIGVPPVWGRPYPLPIPSGPLPILPGSPEDFPANPSNPWPHDSAPPVPGDQPPTDVPEPATVLLFLSGLALIARRRAK